MRRDGVRPLEGDVVDPVDPLEPHRIADPANQAGGTLLVFGEARRAGSIRRGANGEHQGWDPDAPEESRRVLPSRDRPPR